MEYIADMETTPTEPVQEFVACPCGTAHPIVLRIQGMPVVSCPECPSDQWNLWNIVQVIQ